MLKLPTFNYKRNKISYYFSACCAIFCTVFLVINLITFHAVAALITAGCVSINLWLMLKTVIRDRAQKEDADLVERVFGKVRGQLKQPQKN
jgi:hypothetical protein